LDVTKHDEIYKLEMQFEYLIFSDG